MQNKQKIFFHRQVPILFTASLNKVFQSIDYSRIINLRFVLEPDVPGLLKIIIFYCILFKIQLKNITESKEFELFQSQIQLLKDYQ